MKKSLGLVLCFLASVRLLAAVVIGDTYDQVVAEKGAPVGKMQAGPTLILRYADQTIKFKEGRVVSVEALNARAAPPSASAPAPKPAAAPKPAVASGAATWTTNYNAALAQAKEQDRKVMLFFTGSDWCGWCMRLNKEILSTPEFARYAREKLILVELDFPKNKLQSAELVAQNARLQERFRIQGYPTVVILNSAGKPVGDLGYQEGGPGPFIGKIDKL